MSSFDFVPGEQIIAQAKLRKDRWMKYRCVTCSLKICATVYFAPIFLPIYAFCGSSCRQEEADSFDLVLTNQNIHCRQKLYTCGMCCQQSGTKVIPLHRIQDISLASDWIGDSCGIVDQSGDVYQLQIQTAAMGTMLPELCVVSIENPREFKQQILQAKNNLSSNAGNSKDSLSNTNPEDLARILALLQRNTAPSTTP